MQIPVNSELRSIAESIEKETLSAEEWAAIESGDMFQTQSFCGGYDADDNEFLFSWYAADGTEYYFGLSIAQVMEIASGSRPEILGRPAETLR